MEFPKNILDKLVLLGISLAAILWPVSGKIEVFLKPMAIAGMALGLWLYWMLSIALVVFGVLGILIFLRSLAE